MFHTRLTRFGFEWFEHYAKVVIPWRGFRCFTRNGIFIFGASRERAGVVIPWRGFRCFTQKAKADAKAKANVPEL